MVKENDSPIPLMNIDANKTKITKLNKILAIVKGFCIMSKLVLVQGTMLGQLMLIYGRMELHLKTMAGQLSNI
jgi:hypothetical protein